MKLLEKLKIDYQLHQYQHDGGSGSYGLEAANKLGVIASSVFKTLIIETDQKQLAVAIIPVEHKLNLKKLAKSLKCKKVLMAEPLHVQSATGYVLGGVSPFGQKKRLTTFVDESCTNLQTMYVSGGKRGLEIAISPTALIKVTNAKKVKLIA